MDKLKPLTPQRVSAKKSKSQTMMLIVCIILSITVLVLFYLVLTNPAVERSADAPNYNTIEPTITVDETPYLKAQQLNARQAAQDLLASILQRQTLLIDQGANQWASSEMNQIVTSLSEADQLYSRGQYLQALPLYQQTEQQLLTVANSAENQFQRLMSEGKSAFKLIETKVAIDRFSLALLIQPASQDAQHALSRAKQQTQVEQLKRQAKLHIKNKKLTEAKVLLTDAIQLDADDTDAPVLLAELKRTQNQHRYQAAMSNGFSHLSNKNWALAEQAFRSALSILPLDSAALSAIQQVAAERKISQRHHLMDKAKQAEKQEQWAQASQYYQQVLSDIPGHADAKIALIQTTTRAELDKNIADTIAAPLSLQSEASWSKAKQYLADAEAILARNSSTNTRLSEQFAELTSILERSRTPIELHIHSDMRSNIRLLKIGQLGTVNQQAIQLYPGKYTLIATRAGYQDERRDIIIDGFQSPVIINVSNQQRIR